MKLYTVKYKSKMRFMAAAPYFKTPQDAQAWIELRSRRQEKGVHNYMIINLGVCSSARSTWATWIPAGWKREPESMWSGVISAPEPTENELGTVAP